MGKLNTFVSVDGTWYGPDSDIPDEVAAKIANPKVWAEGSAPVSVPTPAPGSTPGDEVKEPPRGGPGSSSDAWAKFADERGVEVPDGASAKDIQALWDEHKAKQES